MHIDADLEQAFAENPDRTVRVIIGFTSTDVDLNPVKQAGVSLIDTSALDQGRVVGEMSLKSLPDLRKIPTIDYISLDSIATIQ